MTNLMTNLILENIVNANFVIRWINMVKTQS